MWSRMITSVGAMVWAMLLSHVSESRYEAPCVCDQLGENSNGKGGWVEVVHPTPRDKAAKDGASGRLRLVEE